MSTIDNIRPTRRRTVLEILNSLNFETTKWYNCADPDRAAANPAFCYNWSFYDVKSNQIVLNVWIEDLLERNNLIYLKRNSYNDVNKDIHDPRRHRRAIFYRELLRKAYDEQIYINVILLSGNDGHSKYRDIDNEKWIVASYDADENYMLVRSNKYDNNNNQFAFNAEEQICIKQCNRAVNIYIRSIEIKRLALARANGKCEYCNKTPFIKNDGLPYLEVHHIKSLCDGGLDDITNVIVLCANDHRRAHYEMDTLLTPENLRQQIAFPGK